MRNNPLLVWALGLGAIGCDDGASHPGTPLPADPAAAVVAKHLASSSVTIGGAAGLDYRLTELAHVERDGKLDHAACQALQGRLWDACTELYEEGRAPLGCDAVATFFFANDIPRCGGRVQVWSAEGELASIVAFDLSGDAIAGYTEQCGDGDLDEGEECDDGNHDEWDGCDPNCQIEEFNGCEMVIERLFAQSAVASVPADAWQSPRSHLMIHPGGAAMQPVDASLCNAARGVAQDVCNELTTTMPFVGWCDGQVKLDADADGEFCAVRLQVGFSRVDQENAVFTTRLPGILAFKIR